jgi:hypothetical protein
VSFPQFLQQLSFFGNEKSNKNVLKQMSGLMFPSEMNCYKIILKLMFMVHGNN